MKRKRVQADMPTNLYSHYAEWGNSYRKDVVHPLPRAVIEAFLFVTPLVNIVLAYLGNSSGGEAGNQIEDGADWKRFITSTLGPKISLFGGSISFCVTGRTAFLKDQTGNQIRPGVGNFFFADSRRVQIVGVLAQSAAGDRPVGLRNRVAASITKQGFHPGINSYLSDGWVSVSFPRIAPSDSVTDVFFLRWKTEPSDRWVSISAFNSQIERAKPCR